MGFWENAGAIAGGILPLFDLFLIVHVIKRKSSKDISLMWAIGLWATSVGMAPAGILSPSIASKAFNIVNVLMLTIVVIVVYKYRK